MGGRQGICFDIKNEKSSMEAYKNKMLGGLIPPYFFAPLN